MPSERQKAALSVFVDVDFFVEIAGVHGKVTRHTGPNRAPVEMHTKHLLKASHGRRTLQFNVSFNIVCCCV